MSISLHWPNSQYKLPSYLFTFFKSFDLWRQDRGSLAIKIVILQNKILTFIWSLTDVIKQTIKKEKFDFKTPQKLAVLRKNLKNMDVCILFTKNINVIETKLVFYAPFYVKKPPKYWSNLGESFQKATWHFVS